MVDGVSLSTFARLNECWNGMQCHARSLLKLERSLARCHTHIFHFVIYIQMYINTQRSNHRSALFRATLAAILTTWKIAKDQGSTVQLAFCRVVSFFDDWLMYYPPVCRESRNRCVMEQCSKHSFEDNGVITKKSCQHRNQLQISRDIMNYNMPSLVKSSVIKWA